MRPVGLEPEVLLEPRGSMASQRPVVSQHRSGTSIWQPPLMVLILAVLVAMATLMEQVEFVSCSTRQQNGQRQPQLDIADQLYGGDYAAALINNNLVDLEGRSLFAGKRGARKMSGFMPMRGRKDGRDEQQQQQPRGVYLPPEEIITDQQAPVLRDSEGETSLLHLAGGWPQRQFANQFVMQHMLANSRPQSLRIAPGEVAMLEGPESTLLVGGDAMMQAKLRRAFHPMRGKKSDPMGEPGNYYGAPVDEPQAADTN